MKYLVILFILIANFSFAQDMSRKEKRQLIKQIRKGDIPIAKKDTIVIPIIKTITNPPDEPVFVPIVVNRDTCIKSRYELRNDRKVVKIEASKEVILAKVENKKEDILADKMADSLKLIIKLSKVELSKIKNDNRSLKDSLNAQIKLVKASSRGEVWGNIKTIAIVILLTILVLIFFYVLKPILSK